MIERERKIRDEKNDKKKNSTRKIEKDKLYV